MATGSSAILRGVRGFLRGTVQKKELKRQLEDRRRNQQFEDLRFDIAEQRFAEGQLTPPQRRERDLVGGGILSVDPADGQQGPTAPHLPQGSAFSPEEIQLNIAQGTPLPTSAQRQSAELNTLRLDEARQRADDPLGIKQRTEALDTLRLQIPTFGANAVPTGTVPGPTGLSSEQEAIFRLAGRPPRERTQRSLTELESFQQDPEGFEAFQRAKQRPLTPRITQRTVTTDEGIFNVTIDAQGNIVSQTKIGNAPSTTPRATQRIVTTAEGIFNVAIDSQGNIIQRTRIGDAPSQTSTGSSRVTTSSRLQDNIDAFVRANGRQPTQQEITQMAEGLIPGIGETSTTRLSLTTPTIAEANGLAAQFLDVMDKASPGFFNNPLNDPTAEDISRVTDSFLAKVDRLGFDRVRTWSKLLGTDVMRGLVARDPELVARLQAEILSQGQPVQTSVTPDSSIDGALNRRQQPQQQGGETFGPAFIPPVTTPNVNSNQLRIGKTLSAIEGSQDPRVIEALTNSLPPKFRFMSLAERQRAIRQIEEDSGQSLRPVPQAPIDFDAIESAVDQSFDEEQQGDFRSRRRTDSLFAPFRPFIRDFTRSR